MKNVLLSAALVFCSAVGAQSGSGVEVKDPWVRATVAGQQATAAFMQLTSRADSRLVQARSPLSGAVEIHEMTMEQDVMKMRQVAGVQLPAGKTVELRPGGYHVMLMDLKAPIKAGDQVPLTLEFEGPGGKRESVQVKAVARPLAGAAAPAHEQMHGHKH